MRLRHLNIQRMPGLAKPMSFDFEDGMNIITGPNGSGKSTLCRAVATLLWPERDTPIPLSLTSTWRDDDTNWHAERHEGQTTTAWLRNGEPTSRPELPDSQLASCFFLGITDLIKPDRDKGDDDLAKRIRRQMAGGFDITAVEEKYFIPGSRHSSRPFEEFNRCRKEEVKLRRERKELAGREDSLAELDSKVAAATRAHARLAELKTAANLQESRAGVRKLRAELDAFPPAMDRVDGRETARLDDMQHELDQEKGNLATAGSRCTDTKTEISRIGLETVAVDQTTLAGWIERARHLNEISAAGERLDEEINGARFRLEKLAGDLNVEDAASLPTAITPELVQEVRQVLAEQNAGALRLADLDTLLEDGPLKSDENPEDAEQLREGIRLLTHWRTAAGAPHAINTGAAPWIPWFLLLGTGLLLGFAGDTASSWIFGLPVSILALLGLAFRFLRRRRPADSDTDTEIGRGEWRRRFDDLPLLSPPTWTDLDVDETLKTLQAALIGAEKAAQLENLRGAFALQRNRLREKVPQLTEQLNELRRRHGVSARPDQDLADFLHGVAAYRECETKLVDLRGRRAEVNAAVTEKLEAVNAFLNACGRTSAADAADAQGCLLDLSTRHHEHLRAVAGLEKNREAKKLAEQKCADINVRISGMFEKLDLEPGDSAALTRLVEKLEAWNETKRELDHCIRDIARDEESLASRPELLKMPGPEIEKQTKIATALAENRDTLLQNRRSILDRLEAANTDGRFAEIQVKTSMAEDRLAEEREIDLTSTAGRFLLEKVRQQHESETRPAVLKKAQKYFADFTRNTWRLEVVDEAESAPQFRAIDNTSKTGHKLEQLSDGTRAQLLLATKLAFADTTAGAAKVPVFLDESLAATDPQRFDAIASSLSALALDTNRQLFYLTSDPSDCETWLRARRRLGLPDVKVLRLKNGSDQRLPTAMPAHLETVPAPSGHDATSYAAALGVSRLEPLEAVDAVHLWYLLFDDLDLLYRLLNEWGLACVGHYRYWATEFTQEGHRDVAGLARLDARIRILTAFINAWRVGRAPRLDRSGLVKLVTPAFLDRIDALLDKNDGDAEALLESLADPRTRIPNFGSKRIAELKESLAMAGYFDHREAIPAEDMAAAVRESLKTSLLSGDIDAADCTAMVKWLLLSCA